MLSSQSLLEPGVFGIVRPVLLLPAGITNRLTASQLEAIVAHEMCHVRRRDNLTAAFHMLVEAALWFHPMVWWIGMKLVEERERACDEAVLQSSLDAETYAEGILNVCKAYVESPLPCISGVTGASLKERIVRIMTEQTGAETRPEQKTASERGCSDRRRIAGLLRSCPCYASPRSIRTRKLSPEYRRHLAGDTAHGSGFTLRG